MKKRVRLWIFLFGLFFLLLSILVLALLDISPFRKVTEDSHSWAISLIERKLSTPNNKVRLYNVKGMLSSQTTIGTVTVSDKKGVWLKIANAKMDWNRLALLKGRMEINQLLMEQITFLRKPYGSSSTFSSEMKLFSLPKLPIDVSINTLTAQRVAFEKDFFGLFSNISLEGHLILANGHFDAKIIAHRLDAPGSFSFFTKISNSNRTAKIDISTYEPQDGILAHVFNIEKHPALSFSIKGDGSFDDLVVKLSLEADHHLILDGNIKLASISEGYSLSSELAGSLGFLISPQYRSFFESDVTLKAEARMTKEGAVHLDHMVIQGKTINVVANAEIMADGFLRRLFVDGAVSLEKKNESTHLPVLEDLTRAENVALTIDYGREGQSSWKGRFVVHNLSNKNVHIRDVIFDMGGVSENLDDVASRHVGIQVNGTLQGITKIKEALTEDLKQTVYVRLDTDIVARKPILIHNFSIMAQDFSAWLKGKVDRFIFKGDLGLKAQALTLLDLFSEQSFSGSADIKAKGTVGLMNGVFDLELSGIADNLKVGVQSFDRLFKGNLTFSGGAAWNKTDLVLRRFDLKNQYVNIRANGYFSSENAKMDLYAQISDLAKLHPNMGGTITVLGSAKGKDNLIKLNAHTHVARALLMGKNLQNTTFTLKAIMDNTSPATLLTGSVKGEGVFANKPLYVSASFKDSKQIRQLQNINIRGGDAKITGTLSQTLEGFVKGALHIDADDISVLSALLLQEGSGKVKGHVIFDGQNGKQKASLKAHVDHLNFAKNKINKLAVETDIFDLFGFLQFEGFINAENIQTPFIVINQLNARASHNNGKTGFTVKAMLHNDTNAQLSGCVMAVNFPEGIKQEIQIKSIDVKRSNFHATLPKSAMIVFNKNGIEVKELGLSVDGGQIMLSGSIQDSLNLGLTMNAFPVALANLWKSDLGAVGTLTGQIMIDGHYKNPNVYYDIKGEGLTTTALQDKKITPFVFSATGKTVDKILTVNANLTGEGMQAQTKGSVFLDTNNLDLHVDLQELSARLVNGFIEGQALGGTVIGKIDIGGSIKDPSAYFELSSTSLTVATYDGLMPINVSARGSYKKATLHIEHMVATGDKGLDFSINGPISLNDLEAGLNIKGIMPLVFIDLLLAKHGAHITGTAKIDTVLNGKLSKPQLDGKFSIVDGSFIDSQTNLGLNNIKIEGKFNGSHILIEKASAVSSEGGNLSASGHITNDLQTDLVIHLDRANYNDGSMILATLSGTMKMTGDFVNNLVVGGEVTVEKAEIIVPDHFQNVKLLGIKNKNLTKPIQKTLERADIKNYSHNRDVTKKSSSVVQLDMRITALNQFFVRGKGLDTELGGRINLTGPLNDVHPVGEFQMIRGRFDILSQRLSFNQGQASFSGNLNPTVYFVTTSNSGDINVTVTVSGTIDNLGVNFSSQPNLPQDEILARLIFKRSLSELSAFQIAQLATVAADLVGNTNISLLNALRTKIGLDDLDVITDEKGNTGLRLGRYIHNNIYLGLEAGANGLTKGTINLDISRNLKAKGAIGNEKNSSIGLFYEKDY
ncbi:translocation/assembly module TamB domain-containing protein [Bartonella doshiae]|uniref:translocation/assembly module TamB domain-containing protein n=3 Tax=Bartonella doshiae TaxID=33044 RepID=UPI0009454819|nr:translocation/assembly module TamB domain-containing protein [Bartonella doshiae]